MLRIGALSWLTLLELCSAGCGRFVSRPPLLEYAEPFARVDVRFDQEPFEIDFSRARDENDTVIAHCRRACRLDLPPGLYRLRAHGDAPEVHKVLLLRHHTHVMVTKGSAELRGLGLGLEASGGLGLAVLTVGAILAPRPGVGPASPDSAESGVGNLAIIGGLGAAALTMGILIHQTSKSRMEINEVEDVAGATRSSLRPVIDAKGVGFSF